MIAVVEGHSGYLHPPGFLVNSITPAVVGHINEYIGTLFDTSINKIQDQIYNYNFRTDPLNVKHSNYHNIDWNTVLKKRGLFKSEKDSFISDSIENF